jgi:hypothetical protein
VRVSIHSPSDGPLAGLLAPGRAGRDPRAAQIADLVRARLGLSGDTAVTVSQLRCREPGCPPVETVVAVLTRPPRRWTLHRPLAEIDDELVLSVPTLEPSGDPT